MVLPISGEKNYICLFTLRRNILFYQLIVSKAKCKPSLKTTTTINPGKMF